jgi:hypothetical protein
MLVITSKLIIKKEEHTGPERFRTVYSSLSVYKNKFLAKNTPISLTCQPIISGFCLFFEYGREWSKTSAALRGKGRGISQRVFWPAYAQKRRPRLYKPPRVVAY